ncbi:MAG: ParB/RepB/Spo0J family partition protein [Epulopiscium sp.]|nr:ParB/RepB/Spo0J family partition protein [Candidatus Epulonipiscium sp.]
MAKRGLGKGLSALISSEMSEENQIKMISINSIEPNKEQPRKYFDEDKLEELASSIKEHGIIQPLIVKQEEDYYVIVAGERRWRAARLAGLKEIPVIIQDYTTKELMEISLIENIQREDLNAIEEAKAYETLMNQFSLTQEELAGRIGKSRPAIANTLRLLQLDEKIQELIIQGEITEGHGRAILRLPDKEAQLALAKKIIKDHLSVRETEKKVDEMLKKPKKKTIKDEKEVIYKEIEDKIKNILGTKVQITRGKKKGKIEIEYYNENDLERILYLLESIREAN